MFLNQLQWRLLALLILQFILSISLKGQVEDSVSTEVKLKKTIFPIAFYLPETSLGFGVSAIGTFRLKNEPIQSKISSVIVGLSYTLKNQILIFVPFEIYKNNEQIRFKGELGFYKYFYNYHGVGSDTNADDLENYDVIYPRIIFSYSRAVSKLWRVGLGYRFDYFNITKIEPAGLLDTNRPIGVDGGRKSVLMLLNYLDTRDNVYAPYKGFYVEAIVHGADRLTLSDYNYFRFDLDMRYYKEVRKDWVLATQFYLVTATDTAPFFDLPYIGESKYARGFRDRRFIGQHLISTQVAVRFPLFWRLRGTVFANSSWLPDRINRSFANAAKLSYGLGLRFLLRPEERTSFRVDVANSKEGFNFYLTLNEAF